MHSANDCYNGSCTSLVKICSFFPIYWTRSFRKQLVCFVVVTSAKEDMFSSLFVCLSDSNIAQKLLNGFP